MGSKGKRMWFYIMCGVADTKWELRLDGGLHKRYDRYDLGMTLSDPCIEYVSDSDGIEAFFVTQLGFDSHFSFRYPRRSLLFAERSAFGFGVCSLPGFQSWFTKKVTIDYNRYLNSSTRILGCGKHIRVFLLFWEGASWILETFGGKRDETWQVYFPMQKGSVMGVMKRWVTEFRIAVMQASCLLSNIK